MTTITPEEVKERLDAGEQLNLLDVREPSENAEFNIGGILLPIGKIQSMQTEDIENLKDEEVICYCRTGGRSNMAGLVLNQLGFTNVKNMVGGIVAWKEKFD